MDPVTPASCLTADTCLSVAVELGLKSAAAAARLILSHAGRPPGGGTTRRPGPTWDPR